MTLPVQPKQVRSTNAIFTTPSTALPAVTLLAPSSVTLTVFTPRVAGDALAAGEPITVTPSAALPGGLNVSYAIVTATNTVVIGLASTVSIAVGSSVAWTVVAHR